jgi:hypothetical protein
VKMKCLRAAPWSGFRTLSADVAMGGPYWPASQK